MRILALSPNVPFPPIGGGPLRTHHLLRSLAHRHELTLVAFTYGEQPASPLFPLRVVEVPWSWPPLYRELHSPDARAALAALHKLADELPEPRFVSIAESPAMERTLRRLAEEPFDAVLIEHSVMARFLPCLPRDVPKVLDLHDVHSLMARRAADGAPAIEKRPLTREAERTVRFERLAASQCTLCLTVSQQETAAARSLLGIDRVCVVPNGVDTAHFRPTDQAPEPGNLLFTGLMSYPPNVEAVRYFVGEVLPILLEHDARFKLHVVGKDPGDDLRQLSSESVVIHGFVPDIRPYFQAATVVVIPLLQGGGTRIKALEAAAAGKAIVSTPFGAEGLDFTPGRDLLVADSPSDFARAVLTLSGDPALRAQLGRRARQVTRRYDWEQVGARLRRLVEGLR